MTKNDTKLLRLRVVQYRTFSRSIDFCHQLLIIFSVAVSFMVYWSRYL